MRNFKDSQILNHTARQLYDLVLDVEQYDKFVPWCEKCKIIAHTDSEIIADLTVKFGFIEKTYRSKITHGTKNERYYIEINQISGLFKLLNTEWNFSKYNKSSTKVDFKIDFIFESSVIDGLIGSLFEHTASKMIEAFKERAKVIYGKN